MSEQILVTGGAGFVGQHLVRRLATEGHDITVVDRVRQPPDMYQQFLGENVQYYTGDILDEDFLDDTLFSLDSHYDRVFHLAAVVGVDEYLSSEEFVHNIDVNVNGTLSLVKRLRGSETRFVYASSSSIYGRNPDVPWSEESDRILGPPTRSRWSYSASKAVCEHVLHQLAESDDELVPTVVRPFNLYGPHQSQGFVVANFIRAVCQNDVPTVYGDGTQTRCFTYIRDFIEGTIRAARSPAGRNEVFNLGNTEETSIVELARLVLDIAGMDEKTPKFEATGDARDGDVEQPQRRVPDVSRANRKLGWSAETSLRAGLERTVSAFRERTHE